MASNIGISITPEEETLIKVVPIPQGPIEWTWLNNTVRIISGKYIFIILFICHIISIIIYIASKLLAKLILLIILEFN